MSLAFKKSPAHPISRILSHPQENKQDKRTNRPLASTSTNTSTSQQYYSGKKPTDRKDKYLPPISGSFNVRDNSSCFPGSARPGAGGVVPEARMACAATI